MTCAEEEGLPEVDVEQFHSIVVTLTDPESSDEIVSEATSFLQETMSNNLPAFVDICIRFATNEEDEVKTRIESLILLRNSLKETNYRKVDIIRNQILKDEYGEIIDNLYTSLIGLMFGADEQFQKAASEAFAQAFNVFYSNWEFLKVKYFSEIKPDTLESLLPTFTFFIDLMYTSFYKSTGPLSEDVFLTGLFESIMRIFSQETIESSGIEALSPYMLLSLQILQLMMNDVGLFNFLADKKYGRFSRFLLTFPLWIASVEIDMYTLAYEILEKFAENGHDFLQLQHTKQNQGEEEEEPETYWALIDRYMQASYCCENQDFLKVSLAFWGKFAEFEFNKLFSNNCYKYFSQDKNWKPNNMIEPPEQNGKGKGISTRKEFYPFTKAAFSDEDSPHLAFFLNSLLNMPDEIITEGNLTNFELPYEAATTIKYIFMICPGIMDMVFNIISEKLVSESIGEVYGALLIIEAMCFQFTYSKVLDFLKATIETIVDIITIKPDVTRPDLLIAGAFTVLEHIYDLYGPVLLDVSIFDIIKLCMTRDIRTNDKLFVRELDLLKTIIGVVSSQVALNQFHNFIDIILDLRGPEVPSNVLAAVEELTETFITRTYASDSHDLLETLKNALVEQMDGIYSSISDTNPIDQYIYVLSNAIYVLAKILYFSFDVISPQEFFECVYKFLDFRDPQLYFIIYASFNFVIAKHKDSFNEAGVRLLESALSAITSGIPRLIGISGRIIGTCMKYLTTEDILEKGFECTSAILSHLSSDDQEVLKYAHSSLIIGFSDSLVGFPRQFPSDQFDAFRSIIYDMVKEQVDKDDEIEVEFYHKLYTSLLISFKNIALYQLANDPDKRDVDFAKWFKNFVFGEFINKRINKNMMYQNKGLLTEFIDFIRTIIDKYRTTFNIQCNSRSVMEILNYALYCRWPIVREQAKECIQMCYNN